MEQYILKNKDVSLVEFCVYQIVNRVNTVDFIDYELQIYNVNRENINIFPFELRNKINNSVLLKWITDRTTRFGEKIFARIMKNVKIDTSDPLRFAKISNLLSLNDTFWICEKTDTRKWNDVNLYENAFNEIIAELIFSKSTHHSEIINFSSPEITSKGALRKAWSRNSKGIFLRKADDYFLTSDGLSQVTSEWFASQIAESFGIDHVSYDLDMFIHRDGRKEVVCTCPIFTDASTGFIDARTYFLHKNISSEDLSLNKLKTLTVQLHLSRIFGMKFYEDMMVFDSLILNQDRHLGNFGYLFDTDSGKILRPAPLFDHGLSFTVGSGEIKDINPETFASNSRSAFLAFDDQARLFLRHRHIPMLENCLNINLKEHDSIYINPESIRSLNNLIHIRAGQLLKFTQETRCNNTLDENDECRYSFFDERPSP